MFQKMFRRNRQKKLKEKCRTFQIKVSSLRVRRASYFRRLPLFLFARGRRFERWSFGRNRQKKPIPQTYQATVWKLRNDKANSFLLFENRTKNNEKLPLFGGPYRNSHRQFFHSPIRRAWSICTTLHLQVKSFLKVWSGAHGCRVCLMAWATSTTWHLEKRLHLKV